MNRLHEMKEFFFFGERGEGEREISVDIREKETSEDDSKDGRGKNGNRKKEKKTGMLKGLSHQFETGCRWYGCVDLYLAVH